MITKKNSMVLNIVEGALLIFILAVLSFTLTFLGCTTMNVNITSDAGGNAEITTSIEQPKTVETTSSATATIPVK